MKTVVWLSFFALIIMAIEYKLIKIRMIKTTISKYHIHNQRDFYCLNNKSLPLQKN